jgi:hypothetical protein
LLYVLGGGAGLLRHLLQQQLLFLLCMHACWCEHTLCMVLQLHVFVLPRLLPCLCILVMVAKDDVFRTHTHAML